MTIISCFHQIVKNNPNNIALLSENEGQFTYAELDQRSNVIANHLIDQKSETDTVGILLGRSFDLVASMLGIMKAGFAYLPLDPSYPTERIATMLNSSNVKKIICTRNSMNAIEKLDLFDLIILEDELFPNDKYIDLSEEEKNACILYTSGSTGVPNGVMMTHVSILNTLKWAINFYKLTPEDVDLQIPSSSFTSSVQDIFSTLLSGGKLIMLNEVKILNSRYLNMLSSKYCVTHFDMVPSLYKEYLRTIKDGSTLRFVILAGEVLSISLARKHFERLPCVRLFNEYGMAETCSCCFVKEVTLADKYISIGKPIANMGYFISDTDQDGVGELYVSGKGLAKGYHKNPKYTNEKFTFLSDVRYLKTGDLVKEEEDQTLTYFCRNDNQVKVNGKRVNLTEIDYVLQSNDNVQDSITTTVQYREIQLIISFIKSGFVDKSYFLNLLKEKVPAYCVPNYINIVEEFLYLPNKKINIKRMREMFIEELELEAMKSDERYKKIIDIISTVSSGLLNQPDIEKDLQQQGIDSISFIRLLAEFEEQFDFEFGYDDIENLQTVSIKNIYQYILKVKSE